MPRQVPCWLLCWRSFAAFVDHVHDDGDDHSRRRQFERGGKPLRDDSRHGPAIFDRFAQVALNVLEEIDCRWLIFGGKGDVPIAKDIEQQIRAGIAQVILNQMMYGTGVGAQIKNNALFTMPEWYMNGLISYISQGWNTEVDNIVRDAVLSGKYNKFSSLSGEGATYAGHSLWHYIALKYGESSIPNIVYMSRLSRNIEKGFLYVLNQDYNTLVQEWLQYYKDLYGAQDFTRSTPPDAPLNKKKKPERTFTQIRISPDQRHVAYSSQELGVYKVYIMDLETGKTKRVYRGGYRLADRPDFTIDEVGSDEARAFARVSAIPAFLAARAAHASE